MSAVVESHVPIELIVADDEEDDRPAVADATRIDVVVNGRMFPTVELEDGRYVAWWHDTDAPEPDDPATEEWVAAPTRFLAAATLRELWENPIAFESLRQGDGRSPPRPSATD